MKTVQINGITRRQTLAAPTRRSTIPPKWRRHHRALLRLLERFMQERHTLAEDSRHPLERSSREIAESASNEFERELALAELAHTQDALYEIEAALKRIESGEYGFCQQTGRPIPAARLRAVPWTRFTREAEVRLERNGAVSGV